MSIKVFSNKMLDSKFWEKYFKVYDVLNLLIPYQDLLDDICNELNIKKGERVLEAGCGTGNLALKIKKQEAEVIGLDNCKEALTVYQAKDAEAKLILADLTQRLPFPDNFFNKIVSNNTLYTISKEKQIASLKELHRVLKPEGKIILANIKKGWNPLKIYIEGVRKNFQQEGILLTIYKVTKMFIPTVKILYYNYLIQKENEYHFPELNEQKELLQKAGFLRASLTKKVYADQGIMNSAYKL